MIDFANVLKVDIYFISKLYLKLCWFLFINLPINDPSIFVPWFLR